MTRRLRTALLRVAPIAVLLSGCRPTIQQATIAPPGQSGVLTHRVSRIDGVEESLEAYRGSVVLVVNTASKCGFTPQYEPLEALYREKRDEGLVVLGFPSDEFLGQEPGTNEEIAAFCTATYGVSFPMYQKVKVKGPEAHPLFRDLAAAAGEPGWNFNKYLIDREGHVVARYASRIRPDDPELIARIDQLLKDTPD